MRYMKYVLNMKAIFIEYFAALMKEIWSFFLMVF